MRLSTKVRYAVRAMIELALHEAEGPQLLKDIARAQGLSPKYLEQLTIPLRHAGLVRSERGPNGGYELTRPAASITALNIVEAMEGPLDLLDCISNDTACNRAEHCVSRKLWRRVGEAMSSSLAETTLADLRESHRAEIQTEALCYQI
jgi:Rrf2 family protein